VFIVNLSHINLSQMQSTNIYTNPTDIFEYKKIKIIIEVLG